MTSLVRVFFLGVALAGSASANAADYAPLDCAKATSSAQKTICGDYLLGQQEARVATLFEWSTSFVAMGQRDHIHDDQRAFIETRDACGADTACLRNAYAKRATQLDGVMSDIKSRGPF